MNQKISILQKRQPPLRLLNILVLITCVILALLLTPKMSRAEQIVISGLTEPSEDSALGLSTVGRITKIHVKEGDVVKKGQLLLELEQGLERLEVERRKLIWQSKAELESVSLQVKTLAQHLQATRDLYQATGSIPLEELENKELEYAFALAERNRLEIAEKREDNEYKTASQQLARRNLYAPFSGIIAEVLVGIGENCEVDTNLIRLVDINQVIFVANVEQSTSQQLSVGREIVIDFDNGIEPVRVEGKISFISPLIDPASGLQTIKAVFANGINNIVPGMAGQLLLEMVEKSKEMTSGPLPYNGAVVN